MSNSQIKTIENAEVLITSNGVNSLINNQGIKEISCNTFEIDTEYFKAERVKGRNYIQVMPKETTDIYEQYMELGEVQHPITVKKALVEPAAVMMVSLLISKGIIGIKDKVPYGNEIIYDSRYFSHHTDPDERVFIYNRFDSDHYAELHNSAEYINRYGE